MMGWDAGPAQLVGNQGRLAHWRGAAASYHGISRLWGPCSKILSLRLEQNWGEKWLNGAGGAALGHKHSVVAVVYVSANTLSGLDY